jgi:hypothetical protein
VGAFERMLKVASETTRRREAEGRIEFANQLLPPDTVPHPRRAFRGLSTMCRSLRVVSTGVKHSRWAAQALSVLICIGGFSWQDLCVLSCRVYMRLCASPCFILFPASPHPCCPSRPTGAPIPCRDMPRCRGGGARLARLPGASFCLRQELHFSGGKLPSTDINTAAGIGSKNRDMHLRKQLR